MTVIAMASTACVVVLLGVIGRRTLVVPSRLLRSTSPRTRRDAQHLRPAAAGVGVLAGLVVVGPWFTVGLVATFLLARRARPLLAERRERTARQRAIPEAIDLVVLAVRAGLTPQQAMAELSELAAAPVRPAFAQVAHRTERGQPFGDALQALPELLGPSAIGLADVIASTDRYGLPLGPALDQLATEARAARRLLDQADARKLPVRLSFPLVACTLPSFVLLAIAPAVIAALSSLGGSAL